MQNKLLLILKGGVFLLSIFFLFRFGGVLLKLIAETVMMAFKSIGALLGSPIFAVAFAVLFVGTVGLGVHLWLKSRRDRKKP